MVEWKHRGRVQAQGGDTEESVPWAQMVPPPESEGHDMLNLLWGRLSAREQRCRKQVFDQVHIFITKVAAAGGLWAEPRPVKKSFLVHPPSFGRRIDVDVEKGCAFVPDTVPLAMT